ncbi:amino acid adenylation domain-containing protein [Pseudoalteromonas sp. SMS1]|uniref:non-ribosomal peptide synthetase n=1 Tax=Pseudoalteromonas sp. SMS1 TaxID=2908894 RepID=UPI001F3665CE|nr:non-ribosomal peptide synthetase [Pseudoalteromonas sp. SMS1]MCF2858428.1 amino acid adenylation domain-containing protein [Pseudoalteromonas sp. SMS1]
MNKLLEHLYELGIKLELGESDNLTVIGKKENLTPELIGEIKLEKQNIIEWLKEDVDEDLATIVKVSERGELSPTSFSQQRLWFTDQLQGGSPEYNMPMAFNVRGNLNIALLNDVFKHIIERHEVLRTVYVEVNGEAKQRILKNSDTDFSIDVRDFRHLTCETQSNAVKTAVEEEMTKPFDLGHDLMLRAAYFQTADEAGVLAFNMHHIASDGWSMDVFTNEFFTLYDAFSQGHVDPFPPLGIQYADYAHWQREHLEGEVLEGQLSYWEKQLSEAPPVHNLPLCKPRPDSKQYVGATVTSHLSAEIAQGLQALAQAHQLTPFMLLHGALSLLLSKHSNHPDIVIGTPVANRRQEALAPLIGFFVNTLVLRANTNHNTLADYFKHIRQVHLNAQSNQDVPFEQLVERLKVPRSIAHTPLFQIMMTTNTDYGVAQDDALVELSGVEISPFTADATQAKFDLTIDIDISDKGVSVGWTYDVSLFTEQAIARLNEHLTSLLGSLSAITDSTISPSSLAVLSQEEAQHLITELNDTATDYARALCLHELFEEQARQNPNNVAVVFADQQLTYKALNEKANQLAHYLVSEQGVKPDALVGLCTERSIEMIVGILGILKAGGAYVPLDPSYPQSRLEHMMVDASLTTIVSHTRVTSSLDAFRGRVIHIDDEPLLSSCSKDNLPVSSLGLDSSNLAYVIYTSGSTGKPKGVEVEHQGVVAFVSSATYANITLASRMLSLSSYAFDGFIYDFMFSLLNGSELFIYDRETILDIEKLKRRIEQDNIENFFCTTALFNLLVENQAFTNTNVKQVLFGGEKCSEIAIAKFKDLYPHISIVNVYGPTESIVFATACELNAIDETPIGKPINNNTCYILDDQQNLVPKCCIGELYVGGASLARGYLNRPELTAERFINNPYFDEQDPSSSQRLYRTGDLVRYLPDDNIEFIGRADDQVKIRGFRIELGEVESQLANQAGVESALVMAKELAGSLQLIGYLIPTDAYDQQASLDFITDLKAQLGAHLPDYMVPSVLMIVDAWPLTHNGKVDKRALPQPDSNTLQQEYIAPSTETELVLSEVWAKLLGTDADKMSVTSNFFELGGHSLLSIRLIAAIRAQFNVELPVQAVFDTSTLTELADAIELHRGNALLAPLTPIERDQEAYAVSFAQQRLWFIDQLQGQTPEYNMPLAFEIKGAVNISLLNQVFSQIIARHEILRTIYVEVNGEARQRIYAESDIDFNVSVSDFREHSGELQSELVKAQVEKEIVSPFNLATDLMLRACYLRTEDELGVLVFNMHHIASDGWSMEVLTKEFFALYDAFSQGKENPLPALGIQYLDYANWQRTHLEGAVLDKQLAYWEKQLADVPPVHSLPLSYPRPDTKQHVGAMVEGSLPASVAIRLQALAKQHQITPFMLLHGALSLLLSRHSNSSDIVVGTPVANRLQEELTPLIGFFVNTQVLRANTEQANLSEYLKHIRQVHLDAQSNQDVPFEQLVERLKVPRSNAHTPLFQIMMTTQTDFGLNEVGDATQVSDVEIAPYGANMVQAKFDLKVDLSISEHGVGLNWSYDVSLFDKTAIERLNGHLCRLLIGLSECAKGDMALHQLPMLAEDEQQYLLAELSNTEVAYSKALCLHELFEQQAKTNPKDIALVCEGQTMTFEALNGQANRLAHYLRETHGVLPDSLVGLCTERSIDTVVGILGIMKAGAAYVPMDPNYPQSRLQYIIEDAALSTIVSHTKVSEKLAAFNVEVTAIDSDAYTQFSAQNIEKSSLGLTSSHLAYVIYTSGSTGQPKGVLTEHRSLMNFAVGFEQQLQVCNQLQNGWLWLSSFVFDASLKGIALLSSGVKLVIPSEAQAKSPDALVELISQHELGLVNATPQLLELIVKHPNLKPVDIISSGDKIGGAAFAVFKHYAQTHKVKFINAYGPTETTVNSSFALQNESDKETIGKPMANTTFLVLDTNLQLTPNGCVGELYIGGHGLARGYLNRPEQTADCFIDNPYFDAHSLHGHDRLYRTGDLVRYQPDGNLTFVGRVDHQVKVRGYRIELGEIESQLSVHPEIDSALVLAKEIAGSQQLIGYVKTCEALNSNRQSALIAELKTILSNQLPDYMVPSMFIALDTWPLTATGKIDNKALPVENCLSTTDEFTAPHTSTERILVNIWSNLLNLGADKISTNTSFFEVGGHSLLLVRLLSKIQEDLHVQVELPQLYEADSIQKQGQLIDSNEGLSTSLIRTIAQSDEANEHIIFVPGVASTAQDFKEVFELLPKHGLNISVLHHLGLNSNEVYFESIDQAVSAYVDEILKEVISENSQITLVGHSFGGSIALEIAVALGRLGISVHTTLLDTYFEQPRLFEMSKEASLAEELMLPEHLKALYLHQSNLFKSYVPSDALDINVEMVFATQSLNGDTYQRYLGETFNAIQYQTTSVEGDHFSMLQGESAKKILKIIKRKD